MEALEARVLLSANVSTPTFVRWNPTGSALPAAGSSSPSGTSPATMRSAYAVNAAMFGTIIGDGTGQTIAIVDAYDQPNIASDLAAFDSHYGLQAPPSFTKISQATGVAIPPTDAKLGWGVEITLDVEWAHVIAPNANILLVEATDSTDPNLYAAVDRARNFAGVSVVSMSWGGDETRNSSSADAHFTTPNGHIPVTFVASTGDTGKYSDTKSTTVVVGYPAASVNVLAVGGTTLTTSGGNYSSETGWGNGTSSNTAGGSGGGLSKYITQPSYQNGVVTQSQSFRAVPDVALDADPNTGVPIYDTYDFSTSAPWAQYGGTSLAAPMWAGIIAIADQGRLINGLTTLDGPSVTLPEIYALPAADFHDITSGNNGFAAGPGYDLVTGRGTPIVNLLVRDLAAVPGPNIGGFTINPATVTIGSNNVVLSATNVFEVGGTITGVTFYRESNGNVGLQVGSDTALGNGTSSGTTFTLSTSTTGLAAGTYTYYAVATDAGSNTIMASATLTVNTPTPTIGAFSINPSATVIGNTATLTASNVTETNGAIASVLFYRESNGITGLQTDGDTLVGTGTSSGSTFTLSFSTAGFSPGTTTYYALATDTVGVTISASAALLLVTPLPLIGGFTINPASATVGATVSLSATNVTETDGTISNVKFYLESNGTDGLQTGSDTLVGTATSSGTTFSLSTATAGFLPGTYTYYAVATDSLGLTTSAAATLQVTAPVPAMGGFTINPASTTINGAVTLSATGVTEAFGSISNVNFYRESNGTAGLQTTTDTLIGAGTSSGTTWSLSTSAAGLSIGTYTYYALATDATGNTVSTSATLLVTNPVSAALFAWNVAGQTNYGTQGLSATTVDVSASNTLGLTRGSGVTTPSGTSSANGFGGETWGSTSAAGIAAKEYVTFGFTVASGYALSFSSIAMNYRVTNSSGPTSGYWDYQINGGAFNLIGSFTNEFPAGSSGGSIPPVSLAAIGGLQNLASGTVVTFRITPFGSSGTHTWYILDGSGNDLAINATAQTLSGISPVADFGLAPTGVNMYTLTTSGAVTLSQDLSQQGSINLVVGANTQTTVNASQHLVSLTINAGAMVSLANVSGMLLDVGALNIAATGHLDLAGNALRVTGSDIGTLRSLLASGQVYSSVAALPLDELAYFRGSDYMNLFGPSATFAGQTLNAGDLLVQVAKTGDLNLDNTLNIDDFLMVDHNYLIPPAVVTWLSGDLNYDGLINAADYALLDSADQQQNAGTVVPAALPNWTAINAAMAKVPAGAGEVSGNVSVVNAGATLYTGPLNVANTLARVRNDVTISGDLDDGTPFNNSQGLLPANRGTWFEFAVAPSNGSNINFSWQIAAPGPMRLLLDSAGDVYFTGDNGVTFKAVYVPAPPASVHALDIDFPQASLHRGRIYLSPGALSVPSSFRGRDFAERFQRSISMMFADRNPPVPPKTGNVHLEGILHAGDYLALNRTYLIPPSRVR